VCRPFDRSAMTAFAASSQWIAFCTARSEKQVRTARVGIDGQHSPLSSA
jgi:hypothetical protein